MSFKTKKTIVINKMIRKGESLTLFDDSEKASVVLSCKGRRSKFNLSGRIISESSEGFKIYDVENSKVELEVIRGAVFLEKVVFFEKIKKSIVQNASKKSSESCDNVIYGVLV